MICSTLRDVDHPPAQKDDNLNRSEQIRRSKVSLLLFRAAANDTQELSPVLFQLRQSLDVALCLHVEHVALLVVHCLSLRSS